jgi:hypothetical protein
MKLADERLATQRELFDEVRAYATEIPATQPASKVGATGSRSRLIGT